MVEEDPNEFIDFISNYKNMVVIKRMRVLPTTNVEDVAFILSGIKNTVYANKYKFSGIDTDLLADTAKNVCKGITKSTKSIAELDRILNDSLIKETVKKACNNKVLHSAATIYLIYELLKNINMPPSITQLQLSKMYKHLKLPKSGRGKKKR